MQNDDSDDVEQEEKEDRFYLNRIDEWTSAFIVWVVGLVLLYWLYHVIAALPGG